MRQNRVTGAFVIFNNEDLNLSNRRDAYENKPGLYIRDLDPISNASFKNMDLLIERAPAAVVRSLGISTDSGWRPQFDFKSYNQGYPSMLYEDVYKRQGFRYNDFQWLWAVSSAG